MDWEEIRNKYPKAFEALTRYLEDEFFYATGFQCFLSVDKGNSYPLRSLFSFFDAEGLKIFIMPERMFFPEPTVTFNWKIFNSKGVPNNSPMCYLSRTDAEEAAFKRAFEVMEERLREGK